MLSPRISRGLILKLWLVTAPANVRAQNSRASSTASYLERGASWMAKGEIERAIADIEVKFLRRECRRCRPRLFIKYASGGEVPAARVIRLTA